jgi:puromycin-sensitive aminopeptidase
MWFGDLVTMKWWNGVWLNEAFATFAESKSTDAFRPEWMQWLVMGTDRARSQETDALEATRPIEFPVASPEEADAMFDVLTYEKGSSVLRMLEQYLGEETFRAGVSHYLKTHSFSNTDNEDLWASLESVSDAPVGEIMKTWIFQGGFPAIDVTSTDDGVELTQRQFRFIGEGGTRWKVPVLYSSADGEGKVLVGDEPVQIEVGDDLIVNAGGEGFYRVNYDEALAESLASRLDDLDPVERLAVVSDSLANVMAAEADASDYLALVEGLSGERENDIWAMALAGLGEFDRIVSSDDRPALQQFTSELLADRVAELGWTVNQDDSDRTRALRGLLLRGMGNLAQDQPTIAQAREIHSSDAEVDAEVADAALMITAANGDIEDFERFLDLSENAPTPQLTVKYLRAAVMVPHPDVPDRIVRMVIDRDIRTQDSFWVLALLLGHRENGPRAWELITENWDDVMAVLPPTNAYRILDQVHYRSEPEVAASIHGWFEDNEIPGADKKVAQKLEQLEVRTRLREREGERLGEVLR